MKWNKVVATILRRYYSGLILGVITGMVFGTKSTTLSIIGIAIIVIILFLQRHKLKELFWNTEYDKIMTLILGAVVGMAFIIMYRTPPSPALILVGVWATFVILLIAKLWDIVSDKICELEMIEAENRHLKIQNRLTTLRLKQRIE